jgi:hypothetical protein
VRVVFQICDWLPSRDRPVKVLDGITLTLMEQVAEGGLVAGQGKAGSWR